MSTRNVEILLSIQDHIVHVVLQKMLGMQLFSVFFKDVKKLQREKKVMCEPCAKIFGHHGCPKTYRRTHNEDESCECNKHEKPLGLIAGRNSFEVKPYELKHLGKFF